MSGDEKRTIFDMAKSGPRTVIDEFEPLTRDMMDVAAIMQDTMLRQRLDQNVYSVTVSAEGGAGGGGGRALTATEIAALRGAGGGTNGLVKVSLDPTPAYRAMTGQQRQLTPMEQAVEDFIGKDTHRRILAGLPPGDADYAKLRSNAYKLIAEQAQREANVQAAKEANAQTAKQANVQAMKDMLMKRPDPGRVLTVSLPPELANLIVGMVVNLKPPVTPGWSFDLTLLVSADAEDMVAKSTVTVSLGHYQAPDHKMLVSVPLLPDTRVTDLEGQLSTLERQVETHQAHYADGGPLARMHKALDLMTEAKTKAELMSRAMTGQVYPSRINPQAHYPSATAGRHDTVGGRVIQEFLLSLDKVLELLDPATLNQKKGS